MVNILTSSEFNLVEKTNPNVVWDGVPGFEPTSTDDNALKFIASYGGMNRMLFEFGTWIGRSALAFSKNYRSVTTMDYHGASDLQYPYEHKGIPCRPGELILDKTNVKFINENSLTYNFDRYNNYFDAVFVDGNHSINGCTTDINSALKIAKQKSLIFIHDYGNLGMGVRAAVDQYDHPSKHYLQDLDLIIFINQ
jgi:predicted O-methyltransferase YrrM